MVLATILAAAIAGSSDFDRVTLADNDLFGDLGEYWLEHMAEYGVTGFAVVAIKEGEIVLLDAIGDSDPFAEKKADIDTRYYIASITKTMTATAIAQLAELGKIDLDAPVKRYLPRFDLADSEYASKVTIRDLLSHKPGIDGGNVVFLDAYTGGITEDRYYTMLAGSTPSKEIQYSNVHFTILGRVIEAVSGKKWQDYLADHVFAPAKMDRTTAYVSATHADPNWAVPLVLGRNGPQLAPYMKTDRTMHAAGGLLTTPRDLARYLMMFLNGGELEGARLLRSSTVEQALSLQSRFDSTQGTIRKIDGFGYGWFVGGYRDEPRFAGHGGGYTGYASFVAMLPEKKSAIAVLVNTGGPGSAFGTIVAIDLLDRLAGYPVDERLRASYLSRLGQFREALEDQKPLSPNPAMSGMLSFKPEAYAGVYENELYGTVTIIFNGGYMSLHWDDLPQVLKSTGMDEFTAHDGASDGGTPAKFIVEAGRVTAIEVTLGNETVRFVRSG